MAGYGASFAFTRFFSEGMVYKRFFRLAASIK